MFAFCSPENFATNFVTTAPDADVTCSMKGDVTPLIAPFRFAADRDNSLVLLASLICVRSSTGSEGFSDHGFQHSLIYISELLDIEAALAGGVLAELGQERLGIAERDDVIQNSCGLAR